MRQEGGREGRWERRSARKRVQIAEAGACGGTAPRPNGRPTCMHALGLHFTMGLRLQLLPHKGQIPGGAEHRGGKRE